MYKDKSITIKNPMNCPEDDKVLTVEQMLQNALFHMAHNIKDELEDKNKTDETKEKRIWPRKWRVLLSNGKNQAAAVKLFFEKFDDVENNDRRLGEFLEMYTDMTGFEVDEEGKGVKQFSYANDKLGYYGYGESLVREESGGDNIVASNSASIGNDLLIGDDESK
ncbi:MAG: hypothetical protein AAB446_02075 [Patescibacteria group bacterium]